MTEIIPAEHDARQAVKMRQLSEVQRKSVLVTDQMHRIAGDHYSYQGRTRVWLKSDGDVLARMRELANGNDVYDPHADAKPSYLIMEYARLTRELNEIRGDITAMNETWRRAGWTRWIECLNSDGHIHSWFGCKTLHPATQLNWRTDLSGKTMAEAIEALGPRLCSVCFPEAPAEHCRSLSDINRSQREADRAARQGARYVKNLLPGQVIRTGRHETIETVAGCKKALRDEVELRDYYGRGRHPFHAESVRAAALAAQVLMARELMRPGTGASAAEIERITANAVKRNRKDGARI